jgi:hypothetical protein
MQTSIAVAPDPGQVSLQRPLIPPRFENLSTFEPGHHKNAAKLQKYDGRCQSFVTEA